MGNKDLYLQSIRGLAIIAVVLIHSFNQQLNMYGANEMINLIFRQFINFPVPLFIFLSGYFVNKDEILSIGSKNFICKRVKKLIWPYLIWSIIGIALLRHVSIGKIVYMLLTGSAQFHLYFIIVLLQLTLLTPFLLKTIENKPIRLWLMLVSPLFLVGMYSFVFITGKTLPFQLNALPFMAWFGFYYYGLLMNRGKENSLYMKIPLYVILYLLSISFSIYEGFLIKNRLNLFELAISQIKISSFLTSFFLINIILGLKKKNEHSSIKMLISLGDNAFGIYFVHVIIIRAIVMSGIMSNITNQVIYTLIMSGVALSISWIIVNVGKKVLGEKWRGLFGF